MSILLLETTAEPTAYKGKYNVKFIVERIWRPPSPRRWFRIQLRRAWDATNNNLGEALLLAAAG